MTFDRSTLERVARSARMSVGDRDRASFSFEERFGRIVEGRCPDHDVMLTVRIAPNDADDKCGVCSSCGYGWQARTLKRADERREWLGDRVITSISPEQVESWLT